jgi:hypothetical protein
MDQFTTLKKWGGKYGVQINWVRTFFVIQKEKRQPGIENCMQKKKWKLISQKKISGWPDKLGCRFTGLMSWKTQLETP